MSSIVNAVPLAPSSDFSLDCILFGRLGAYMLWYGRNLVFDWWLRSNPKQLFFSHTLLLPAPMMLKWIGFADVVEPLSQMQYTFRLMSLPSWLFFGLLVWDDTVSANQSLSLSSSKVLSPYTTLDDQYGFTCVVITATIVIWWLLLSEVGWLLRCSSVVEYYIPSIHANWGDRDPVRSSHNILPFLL